MKDYFLRYGLGCVMVGYMVAIVGLHLCGLFPRAGVYDISHLIGRSSTVIEGRVLDSPLSRWNQTRFLLEGGARPQSAFCGRVLVTLNFVDDRLAPGDRIRVYGWLSRPRPLSVGRDFDEQSYWASRRVFTMLKVWSPDAVTVLKPSSAWSLERLAWNFHRRYEDFWKRYLWSEESGLLLGITVGARGVLSSQVKEACIRAGVYHIVVVSGQNMSLIVSLGVSLLLLFRVARRHAFWLCFLPILFYTTAVGGAPPVMRAAVTALVGLFATMLGRDIPRYCPLFLAAAWILIPEPEALLGASFQLSFGATLSILALLPILERKAVGRSRWRRWIQETGILGICVYLGIWPVLVFYFHRISLAGLLANWTVFPLSGALMVLGLFIGTWGVFLPHTVPLAAIASVRVITHALLALIEWMSTWSWAVRAVPFPPAWIVGLYYGILFGILFLFRRRKTYAEKIQLSTRRARL